MLGDTAHPSLEQLRIAAKLVDNKTTDHRAVGGVQDNVRSNERCDHMPAIDITDQYDRQTQSLRQPHVGMSS